ncbi:glycoside hydrolase family 3 protein [Devosia sp. WQ 349]|uniref:glycoside hydrolase family 3 protein n=1 Tax=Devosia sp. WQ 349K1 TaxID=2800329 RepID=UPI001903B3E7|nr:glycoside hydrolase family 3 protein [Devosia sp. WQ 349K1]MBK1793689.1 glycoside hydrolase family 3 protein [Devosia sp. WQ 349K1]
MLRTFAFIAVLLGSVSAAAAASLAEKAGQMVVVGFEGTSPTSKGVVAVTEQLAEGAIGGVMFLKKNVSSLAGVAELNASFRAASPDVKPFITLDQEGGSVERLTKDVGFKEIPNAARIAAVNSVEQAETIYAEMARGIADVGFSVNFGPVADLNTNLNNQIIAKFGRSYSADPAVVAAYDSAFIQAHHEAGLVTALKHFPGHGSSTADSHEGYVDITKTWSDAELEPYRLMQADGLMDMVMVGHLYHADYSDAGDKTPSSLSRQWIDGVLRSDIGFDGVVITDDLEMGAIRDHYTLEQTVTRAVRAGVDVLLFSNTAEYRPELGKEIRDILVSEAERDPEFAKNIDQSYQRILALKSRIR